jgi:hypothetical protein
MADGSTMRNQRQVHKLVLYHSNLKSKPEAPHITVDITRGMCALWCVVLLQVASTSLIL